MGKTSSPYRRISTTNITRTGSFTKTTPKEKSGRENKMHQISEQSFYSPKEKFCRRKMDYGSVKTKCIYKMPQIQNVNDARSKTPITEKLLVHIPGPQRRILAYPSVPSEKTISRFPIPKAKLAVSSYAFRPQHCTQNFHESDSSYSQSDGKRRYMVLTIPRRPSNSSTDKRKMSTPSRNGNKNIGRFWVDNQPRKIPSTTSSKLRVVRTPSRSQVTHSENYSNQHGRTTEKTEIGNNIQILLKKKNYETTRSSQLDWSDQSNHSYDDVTNKSNTKKVQKTKVGCKNNTSQRHETKSHQVDKYTKNSTITGKSYTHNYNTNRCITKRLGIPNQPENLPRRVRSVYGNMVNKHSRTTNNLVCITHDTNKRSSDTGTMRQLNSCISSQKEYFHNIPSSNDHRTHLEKSSHDGLVTNSITHTRQIQRNCRPIEQKRSTINRMVVTNKSIQINLKKVFPKLQVDLFATHLNNQLKMYVSPCPDQEAIAVDAMTIPWNRWNHLYLYPPTTMIPKVLAKLTESKIKSAILITPEMPTRPWYMALKLRRIPSIPLKVRLQQIVVDKLVKAPISTNLRVWQL